MLMHPYLDIPYNPRLKNFLGGFDTYDREESLGVELSGYDPECPSDRDYLIFRFIVNRFSGLSYRHKFVLFNMLGDTLESDVSIFIEAFKHDPLIPSLLPLGLSNMKNPRAFFEDIYIKLSEVWLNDLCKAGREDRSTW
ncbi:hypothetical protein [Pseudomonas sp. TH15]|uniref:hypothetical protein n=1 Tax=Pseudomonas sp. TH15 TaxID=2796381 RepID=UPI001913184C|nr:hypothetical protein [Pseudomonas sp. TH15]MBK5511149.1 hypothetical protein [Pseudomonas sp. TH15]